MNLSANLWTCCFPSVRTLVARAAASGDVTRLNGGGQFKPFVYLNGRARRSPGPGFGRSEADVAVGLAKAQLTAITDLYGPSRFDIQRVERMTAGHEQAVLLGAAE